MTFALALEKVPAARRCPISGTVRFGRARARILELDGSDLNPTRRTIEIMNPSPCSVPRDAVLGLVSHDSGGDRDALIITSVQMGYLGLDA